jgi:enamine deaminase RidA (YjgF/YER057c/UK114 family)
VKVETDIGYSQAVRLVDVLYVSGSAGAGEMPKAILAAYEEIRTTLAAHGLDFRNVVRENVFATDLEGSSGTRECARNTTRSPIRPRHGFRFNGSIGRRSSWNSR